MRFSKDTKKQVHKVSPKRKWIISIAVLFGVLGMTLLVSMGSGFLPLLAADTNIKVSAKVQVTSLTSATEEDIIPGRGSDAENATEADVGDTIVLSVYNGTNSESNALIFYTTEASVSPGFTLVQDSGTITSLNAATGKVYANKFTVVTGSDRNYIGYKQNDNSKIWYSYNSKVKIWDCSATATNDAITVPESIRKQGSFRINVMPVLFEDTNYVARSIDTLSFGYLPRRYVGKVSVSYADAAIKENVEQTVDMAASFRVVPASSTLVQDVRYFYTLDGSIPQYRFNSSTKVMEAANDATKLLSLAGNSITVTPDIANFGESFTMRVTGVAVDENQNVVRVERSQTYLFKVNTEETLPAISAYPTSTDSAMAEVKKGDVIKLYVGQYTIDANTGKITCAEDQTKYTIYYTTDGSEPSVNTDGEPQGTTLQYSSASGIMVPAPTGNMFTIRAFATNGKWSYGPIANFSYTYPSAIHAPYANPVEGNVANNTVVNLKCSTEGASIYYTISTNGEEPKDPTTSDMLYSDENPIVIKSNTIIKAVAYYQDMYSSIATFRYGLMSTLAAPTASIASGSVVPPGTTLTLSAAEGTTIHYTTDGSSPLDPENSMVAIGNIVPLNGDIGTMITVKAYASKEDYSDSPLAMFVYTISNYSGGIYADIEDGSTVKNGDVVTLNTDVTDATIYYTTDGSNPTVASSQGSKVTISGEPGEKVVLKAIAVASGSTRTTATGTFSYTIMEKLKAPQSSVPDGAVFTTESQVVLTAEDGKIFYTTDGSDPTESSVLYTSPIEVTKDVTIRAVAMSEEKDISETASFSYTFADKVETPTVSEENGELEIGSEVIFSCKTKNVTMYYTTNGTDPDLKDKNNLTIYTGPIVVNKAMTIKLIATKENMQASDIVTARFTVREPVEVVVEEEKTTNYVQDTSGRLVSRRTFAGADSGPSHSDFVIRNINYGAVLSADSGVVADNAQLVLSIVQSSQTSVNLVKQLVDESYNIVQSYDVSLVVDGMEIEPEGEVELGLAIPSEYENAIIKVVQLQDDGTIQIYETRRSNGVAYANIQKTGVYAIIAPIDQSKESNLTVLRNIAIVSAFVLILAGGGLFIRNNRKKKKQKADEN
ncbi:MAG: chitobiase/beta-hexosaminidase C-terminal domain-containing protein [Lachnospiraceae bacterium]|nr:chitobiase/beta-hexosaminidase C-terminal domain-containing protein [Lachnospiraceae bacterium]